MKLTGLHILLTYQCTFACEHCFVFGSPYQSGTLTGSQISSILEQARDTGTVTSIYFEGGEPFLYYPVLVKAVKEAHSMGFSVGIVSNAYWANSVDDARQWLLPFAGILKDLTVSSDLFHYNEKLSRQSQAACEAAAQLGIPTGVITIEQPDCDQSQIFSGQIPEGDSGVMYRGRAAGGLAAKAQHAAWFNFTECPYEELREPGRVHLDPLGNLHICQGISIGNLFERPLAEICASYQPDAHPIVGPLLKGGPAELARRYEIDPLAMAADACHLCFLTRLALRTRFPDVLTPDQMYQSPD